MPHAMVTVWWLVARFPDILPPLSLARWGYKTRTSTMHWQSEPGTEPSCNAQHAEHTTQQTAIAPAAYSPCRLGV